MRATGAILIVIGTLALGFVAISFQAQSVRDTAIANGTDASAAAYNATTGIIQTTAQTLTPALLYGGLAVMALAAVGLLATYGLGGR